MSCIQNNIEFEASVEESVRVKFWTNEVIWREIMSYLNLTDLKYLSCVNKDLNLKVRCLARLKPLFRPRFNKCLFSLNNTSNIRGAVVEVDRNFDDCLDEFIKQTLRDLEYLELQKVYEGEISSETINARLIRIISSCEKLQSLAFAKFLDTDLDTFFANDGVKTVFRNLRELTFGVESQSYGGDGLPSPQNDDSDSEAEDHFPKDSEWAKIIPGNEAKRKRQRVFELLEHLEMKLSKFNYMESEAIMHSCFLPKQVLASSEETLVELNLAAESTVLKRLKEMKFPNLIKFSVITNARVSVNCTVVVKKYLIPFLQNHILSLKDFKFSAVEAFSLVLLSQVFRTSKNIAHLEFKTDRSFTTSVWKIDWSFLQSLSTLRSFKLAMVGHYDPESYNEEHLDDENDENDEDDETDEDEDDEDDEDDGNNEDDDDDEEENDGNNEDANEEDDENNEVLNQQPPPSRCDDWARYLPTLPSSVKSVVLHGFEHLNENDVTSVVTTSFVHFENLTALKLTKCGYFLNDETLQFICSKLTKLTYFIGEFDVVTDFGISGRRECGTESGISLKNLKGLKKLEIRGRQFAHEDRTKTLTKLLITWEGLLRSVAFLELVEFKLIAHLQDAHYDQRDSDSKDGYAYHRLVRQNPSLENIDLAFYTPRGWFLKELPKINSRIKIRIPIFECGIDRRSYESYISPSSTEVTGCDRIWGKR